MSPAVLPLAKAKAHGDAVPVYIHRHPTHIQSDFIMFTDIYFRNCERHIDAVSAGGLYSEADIMHMIELYN